MSFLYGIGFHTAETKNNNYSLYPDDNPTTTVEERFGDSDGRFVYSRTSHISIGNQGPTRDNILNIFGYVPVVGIFTAITRWQAIATTRNYPIDFVIVEIVRGIFEFLGLGLVVGLLADLPVSLVRHCGRRSEALSND